MIVAKGRAAPAVPATTININTLHFCPLSGVEVAFVVSSVHSISVGGTVAQRQLLADGRSCGDQLVVGALQGHQLVVGSLLDHEAAGHDGDDVRVLDGGEAVGDDDARATLSGLVQRRLHGLQRHTHVLETLCMQGPPPKHTSSSVTAIRQSWVDDRWIAPQLRASS